MADAAVAAGFCAEFVASGLDRPRGIALDADRRLLVLERSNERILALGDGDGDGYFESFAEIASAPGINHGLAVGGGFLYASSDETVYRWDYGADGGATGRREVVTGISANGQGGAPGGHTTRTLALAANHSMYVSVGSAGNVDADSYRSRVRDCGDLRGVEAPVAFDECEVFADGLRNEVGLDFDRTGHLWGVENGADRLERDDLGGDIHDDNPAEELQVLARGDFYGYPWCWSEFDLDGSPGRQWAWPGTGETDEWCRENARPPELAMQAHSAPLGIAFYAFGGDRDGACAGGFPADADGDAYRRTRVAFPPRLSNFKGVPVGSSRSTGRGIGPCPRAIRSCGSDSRTARRRGPSRTSSRTAAPALSGRPV